MDVFELRHQVIDDYASYVRSFFTIRDPRVEALVENALTDGQLWPDPLLQLSPSFQPGEPLDELIAAGELHAEARRIFAVKSEDGTLRSSLRLHRHQVEGIRAARAGASYVLTTGTGSGKSLGYIVPIVDHVLRAPRSPGIKAIVVYPMNALVNSQRGELKRYLCRGYPRGAPPVTFARYTGQESDDERKAIIETPPDILLTNYVMLELLLTRPWDAEFIRQARGLRFLVLDELHTYRGRQGADVALLVRRVRDACGSPDVIHVGTSATMSTDGSWPEQQRAVATVASKIFGVDVEPERIIGETLRRATAACEPASAAFRAALRDVVARDALPSEVDAAAFLAHPLSSWVESTLGLEEEAGSARLVRSPPTTLRAASTKLAEATSLDEAPCLDALRRLLLAGSRGRDANDRPLFAFRLHQFISRGDAVYASPEPENTRHLTLRAQRFVPASDRAAALLPVAFCRECGQDYYVVHRRETDDGRVIFEPRELNNRFEDEGAEAGYLFISSASPWPDGDDRAAIVERLPDSWLEPGRSGALVPRSSVRDRLPRTVTVSPAGYEGAEGVRAAYFRSPFLLCMQCQVTYGAHQTSDFAKLATLGSEGRSTATTLLTMSAVRKLRRDTTRLRPLNVGAEHRTTQGFDGSGRTIVVTTPHSFNGYEAEVVWVAGLDGFHHGGTPAASSMYVALTRARSLLVASATLAADGPGRRIVSALSEVHDLVGLAPTLEDEAANDQARVVRMVQDIVGPDHEEWLATLLRTHTVAVEPLENDDGELLGEPAFLARRDQELIAFYLKEPRPSRAEILRLEDNGITVMLVGQHIRDTGTEGTS